MGNYDAVFSPIKVGSIELKNRVMIAPMEGTGIIDWLVSCKSNADAVHDYSSARRTGSR